MNDILKLISPKWDLYYYAILVVLTCIQFAFGFEKSTSCLQIVKKFLNHGLIAVYLTIFYNEEYFKVQVVDYEYSDVPIVFTYALAYYLNDIFITIKHNDYLMTIHHIIAILLMWPLDKYTSVYGIRILINMYVDDTFALAAKLFYKHDNPTYGKIAELIGLILCAILRIVVLGILIITNLIDFDDMLYKIYFGTLGVLLWLLCIGWFFFLVRNFYKKCKKNNEHAKKTE